jgi:hypothetical protein
MTTVEQQQRPVEPAVGGRAKEPLRVALLIDSYVQPRWVHRIVSDIFSSSVATVVAVVKNESTELTAESTAGRLAGIVKLFLYKVYSRIDAKLFVDKPDAFEKVDIAPLLSNIPVVGVKPIQKKFSDEFLPEDSAAIAEYRVDVALRFGFRILKGAILRVPKYGVWSYHHGDNTKYRGGPPGFWEVMEGEPTTGAILQVLSEELDNGRVIYRACAETDPFSVRRNANRYYWQTVTFVLRKLSDVYYSGPAGLENASEPDWNIYSRPLYKAPTNGPMLRLLGRLASRYLAAKIAHCLYYRQWFLAYKIGNAAAVDGTFYKFKRLIPPKDRFWADPFAVEKDGRYYIFFEELLYQTGKGHLAVMEVDRKGIVNGPQKILERPHHLSYPFVFSWNGDLYMVPESGRARVVELYRCTSFPDKWELEAVLLSGMHAVDTTLAEIHGRWWMFTSIQVEGSKDLYELHLFHAPSPLGPWEPHQRNPIRPDAHSSRPAGAVMKRNGVYYRIAQEGPGHGMLIYKIERLDEVSYAETEVGRIRPDWAENLLGTHTLNSSGGLTVIDGLLKRRRYF